MTSFGGPGLQTRPDNSDEQGLLLGIHGAANSGDINQLNDLLAKSKGTQVEKEAQSIYDAAIGPATKKESDRLKPFSAARQAYLDSTSTKPGRNATILTQPFGTSSSKNSLLNPGK